MAYTIKFEASVIRGQSKSIQSATAAVQSAVASVNKARHNESWACAEKKQIAANLEATRELMNKLSKRAASFASACAKTADAFDDAEKNFKSTQKSIAKQYIQSSDTFLGIISRSLAALGDLMGRIWAATTAKPLAGMVITSNPFFGIGVLGGVLIPQLIPRSAPSTGHNAPPAGPSGPSLAEQQEAVKQVLYQKADAVPYLTQKYNGDCILTSLTMMTRRRLAMEGKDYSGVTVDTMISFNSNKISMQTWQPLSVGGGIQGLTGSSVTSENVTKLGAEAIQSKVIDLLQTRPEGVTVWFNGPNGAHALLVEKYVDGQFIVSNPVRTSNTDWANSTQSHVPFGDCYIKNWNWKDITQVMAFN